MASSAVAILDEAMRGNARNARLLTVLAGVLAVGGLVLDGYAIWRGHFALGLSAALIAASAVAPLRAAVRLRAENGSLAALRAALTARPDGGLALDALRTFADRPRNGAR